MIRQYKLSLMPEENKSLPIDPGYQFYGLLIELVDQNYAELLHSNGINPISQYVIYKKEDKSLEWTVNLLGEQACEQLSPILETKNSYQLNKDNCTLNVKKINMSVIPSDKVLIENAHELVELTKPSMEFITPTSFKTNQQYHLFPSVEQIINNLVHRWNCYSQTYSIDDKDAVETLISSVQISGYDLHSCYFGMKGIHIPAFKGELRLSKKMSIPMAELFQLLLHFSEYSGVGIKTSLGMGAVKMRYR